MRKPENGSLWLAALVALIMLAFILAILMSLKGCSGIQVEREAEFRQGGAYYTVADGEHQFYGGASGDLILNVGVFEFGAAERLRATEAGLSSSTEFLVRLYERLAEGAERPPAVYLEVAVSLVIDTITGVQEVCFDVSGQFDILPQCYPLPWLDSPPEVRVEGASE